MPFIIHYCKDCDSPLVLNENWSEGQFKVYSYVCIHCKQDRGEVYRRSKGIQSRDDYKKSFEQVKNDKSINDKRYWKDNPERRTFYGYKTNAKKRGISFELTFEQFVSFANIPCEYCGCEISNLGNIGIDRVENIKGYEFNNLVSCCKTCNWMKMDLTYKEFVTHCKRIVDMETNYGRTDTTHFNNNNNRGN